MPQLSATCRPPRLSEAQTRSCFRTPKQARNDDARERPSLHLGLIVSVLKTHVRGEVPVSGAPARPVLRPAGLS